MWKSTVDGQVLHFRLAGINNQNFLMLDEETGSWWQQVTGEAIQGPLKGRRLELLPWDEVSFAVWRREHPDGDVLRAEDEFRHEYLDPEWEELVAGAATVVDLPADAPLEPRDLVVSLALGDEVRAYPMAVVEAQSPIIDRVAEVPILVVAEGRSVRCFDRRVDGEELELFQRPADDAALEETGGSETADYEGETAGDGTEDDAATALLFVDAQTGSTWDFSGTAIDGPLAGRRLERLQTVKDFYFDWQLHNPEGEIYTAGQI